MRGDLTCEFLIARASRESLFSFVHLGTSLLLFIYQNLTWDSLKICHSPWYFCRLRSALRVAVTGVCGDFFMGLTMSTLFGECCLAVASAFQCRIVQVGFYSYRSRHGDKKILVPSELSRTAFAWRRNRRRKGCRRAEHPGHGLVYANATNRSLHRQFFPFVGCESSFRQQTSAPAMENGKE